MSKPNIPKKYFSIWKRAVPYLINCRSGDLLHSKKAAEEAYKLGKNKGWDMDILIPVAILHDIGHSAILSRHFRLISGPKKEENSKLVHMLAGAKIANDILKNTKYPKNKITKIVDIISIHDEKDKNLFDTKEKKISHDIDRLDRFSENSFRMEKKEFGIGPKKVLKILEEKLLPEIILDDFRKKAEQKLNVLKNRYKLTKNK